MIKMNEERALKKIHTLFLLKKVWIHILKPLHNALFVIADEVKQPHPLLII